MPHVGWVHTHTHTHPSCWQPAPESGGRHWRCSFSTYFSYPFRLMCFVWHHRKKILSLQKKYFITKKTKIKKASSTLHWLGCSLQPLTWHHTERESNIVCLQMVPIKTPSFEPELMSIVLETKSGVCSRTMYVLPFPLTRALAYSLHQPSRAQEIHSK